MPRKPDIQKKERYNDPFPSRLRELMRENHITQDQLLDVLELKNRQSVTGYIDGETLPTIDKLSAIADFFGVSSDYMLGRSSNKTNDMELEAACSYTGLSVNAVNALRWKGLTDKHLLYLSILIENYGYQISCSMKEIERITEAAEDVLSDVSATPEKLREILKISDKMKLQLYYFSDLSRQIITKSFNSFEALERLDQAAIDIQFNGEDIFDAGRIE